MPILALTAAMHILWRHARVSPLSPPPLRHLYVPLKNPLENQRSPAPPPCASLRPLPLKKGRTAPMLLRTDLLYQLVLIFAISEYN